MGEVLQFKRPKATRTGDTLCRSGHHKWLVVQEKQFDVKEGKLVTLYRCKYCGKSKTKLL